MPDPKYAFKCRECGALHIAGAAGERHLPSACRICGAGVEFHPRTGIKTYIDDNWIVLADLTETQLAKHELEPKQVEAHSVKAPSYPQGAAISRTIEEGTAVADVASASGGSQ